MSTPSSSFNEAAAYLSSASSLSQVSNSVKLELYGLFKYLTVSADPTTSRPSIFDFSGRAKWDAWSLAGRTYATSEEAEIKYLELAKDLGWTEGAQPETTEGRDDDEEDDGDIWDDDRLSGSRTSGGGEGFGTSVSTMQAPGTESDGTLHSLALNDDVPGIIALFDANPDTNINERDEFDYTPLHLASDRGNLAAVKVLLSKGAEPSLKDPDGLPAWELADIAGHDEIAALLRS